MTDFIETIAQPDQPHAIFKAVEAEVTKTIGAKLFTIMELDRKKCVARRSYTNMPDAYPATGEKPMREDAWSAQVQEKHQTFVANSIEEIAAVFPDHELIQSLGCESCLNLPIVVAGQVIGTLNCLHDAGHYTPERVAAAEKLKQAGVLALLVASSVQKGT